MGAAVGVTDGGGGGMGGIGIGGGGGMCIEDMGGGTGGASAKNWWGLSAWDRGFWAASSLSAAEPCLSPLESFLKAYEMEMFRLHRYWPFMASMAASEASKLA